MDGGWIKLHRKSKKSAVMQNPVAWLVWCHLLIDANIDDRQTWDGKEIRRGEVVIGMRKYAKEIGITYSQLRTALNGLERLGNISARTDALGTVVTVCNYSTYQDKTSDDRAHASAPLAHQSRTASAPLAHQSRIDKNTTRSKEGKKERSNRGFAPPSLAEVSAYCQERGNNIDPSQFCDYYAARGWKLKGGQTMKDWRAAVRTWERNETAKSKYQPIPEDF